MSAIDIEASLSTASDAPSPWRCGLASVQRRALLGAVGTLGLLGRAAPAAAGATEPSSPPRLSAPVSPQAARLRLRLAHVVTDDTPKGQAARLFQQRLAQRSGGRIQVDVFPNGTLYGDPDEVQALQLGAVELIAPSLSKFGRIGLPQFELFDLPFQFDDLAAVRRVTQGPLGQRLLAALGTQGLVGLGYFDNGFKHMSANRALREPADYRGLRLRVQASRVIADQMRALGALPVTLAFSETRRALASGVVDGTENPVSNFWTQRMNEVQSDLTLTAHGYLGYAVVSNQRFWLSLSETDRALITDVLAEALHLANTSADAQNTQALVDLARAGTTRVHTLSAAQRQNLRMAVRPVAQALGRRIGQGWINALHNALNLAERA